MGAIICHLLGVNNMSLMGVRLYVTYGGTFICHLWGYVYMSLMGVRLYVTHGVHSHVTYWGTLICHSLKDKGLGYLFY